MFVTDKLLEMRYTYLRFESLLIVALLVDFCNATQHSSGKRIVGGKDAARGKYPAYGVPTGNVLCGATLIAPDLMISAAHCKGAFTSGPSAVAIGGTKLKGDDAEEILGVAYEVAHPEYDPKTAANDIMLVKLDMPAKTKPIRINDDDRLPLDGTKIVIIGFGNTEFEGNVSPILQEIETNIVPSDMCSAAYEKVDIAVDRDIMLCTGVYGGGKGSCQGDSGGPLFSQDADDNLVLVATVSWGKGCASAIYPGVNVRISAYGGFIDEAICQLSDYPPAYCDKVFYTPAWVVNATSLPNADEELAKQPTVGLAAGFNNGTEVWDIFTEVTSPDKASLNDDAAESGFETNTTIATDIDSDAELFDHNATNTTNELLSDLLAPMDVDATTSASPSLSAVPSKAPSLMEGDGLENEPLLVERNETAFNEGNETSFNEGNETSFIYDSSRIDMNETDSGGNQTSLVPSLAPSVFPSEEVTHETIQQIESSSYRRMGHLEWANFFLLLLTATAPTRWC